MFYDNDAMNNAVNSVRYLLKSFLIFSFTIL